MPPRINFTLRPIATVRSPLKHRKGAPRQGSEGAPDVWLDINPKFAKALHGIAISQELILISWLHHARRSTLKVHPRGNKNNPRTGVFATRSPDRPNPLGLHNVRVLEIAGTKLKVGPLEAIDGTPILDIKPVLCP